MALSQPQLQTARQLYALALSRGLAPNRAREFVAAAYSESGLNPNATNKSSGAAGLFQLLSGGYRSRAKQLGGLYNPRANALAILPNYQSYWKSHPGAAPGDAGRDVELSGMGSSFYSRPLGMLGNLGGGQAPAGITPPPAAAPGAPPVQGVSPDLKRQIALQLMQGGDVNWAGLALKARQAQMQAPKAYAPTQAQTRQTPPHATVAGKIMGSNFASPLDAGWKFARVDQGVDYTGSSAVRAPRGGVVTRIGTGWAGGTGKAVYVRFDHPLTIGGRTYDGFYSAHTNPLIRPGHRVNAGAAITTGGSGEIGLTINGQPATLVGGVGAGTKPTQAGQDLLTLLGRRR